MHLNQAKLEGIQQDLVVMETELEDTKKRKSELLRELQNLKHHVKGQHLVKCSFYFNSLNKHFTINKKSLNRYDFRK